MPDTDARPRSAQAERGDCGSIEVNANMATSKDLRRIALSLPGTTETPHFERAAFKVAKIYATLPADGLTANLKLSPDEQELKCLVATDAFAPVPNAWGQHGWTTVTLSALSVAELKSALKLAWAHVQPKPKTRSPGGKVGPIAKL